MENNPSKKSADEMLGSLKENLSPETIAAAKRGDKKALLESVSEADREKINALLKDKQALSALLKSPEALTLLKLFSGGKNG
ncbi:MAG: hypothetical protein IKD04_07585 [Clostridia bacterium]|nr:hypothetical protein [Clostridia bacterium]